MSFLSSAVSRWLGARPPPIGESGAFGPSAKGLAGARSWRIRVVGSRRVGWVGSNCRTVVHSPSHRCLGLVVLRPPLLSFADGAEEHERVCGGVGFVVGPDEPGQPVRTEYAGGHSFDVGGEHPGRIQRFTDDGGSVGFVPGEGLAGPVAGDQDAAAAAAEVFPIMRLCWHNGQRRGRVRVGRVGLP